MLYAGALTLVGIITPVITVPTATGTAIKAWSDRAEDTYRLNLSSNRPPGPRPGSHRRLLPAARPERAGRSARDRHDPGRLRRWKASRPGSNGLALPEPDDADSRLAVALLLWHAARALRHRPAPATADSV